MLNGTPKQIPCTIQKLTRVRDYQPRISVVPCHRATGVLLAWSFSTTPGDTFPPRAPTPSQVIAKHILGMILKNPSIPGRCKEAFSFFPAFRTPPLTVEEEHRKATWGSEKAHWERWVHLVVLPPKTAGQLPFESVIHIKPL